MNNNMLVLINISVIIIQHRSKGIDLSWDLIRYQSAVPLYLYFFPNLEDIGRIVSAKSFMFIFLYFQ